MDNKYKGPNVEERRSDQETKGKPVWLNFSI